jgi:elongation factor P hydroxylase
MWQSTDLETLFNKTFSAWNTILVGGAKEPYYRASSGGPHVIEYREDYFRSALHEIAHWCIAGQARRQLDDFGYWYTPDGRSREQQSAFEQVEVKPQSIEWGFCLASGHDFSVSTDNLLGDMAGNTLFRQNVLSQTQSYFETGFPKRASMFIDALLSFYRPPTFVLPQALPQ